MEVQVSLGAAALGISIFFYLLHLVYKMVIRPERTSIPVELQVFQHLQDQHLQDQNLQNQQQADILKRRITSMAQIMGCHAAFALELIILFTADDRITRPFAVAIAVFAALAFLCFIGTIRSLSKASFLTTVPFAQLDIQDPEKYMEVLMVLGFVLGEVGYRLFYFTLALVTGCLLGPIPMLLATGVLVLYLLITDSYPPMRRQHLPVTAALPREDPAPVRHHQIIMQYLLARNIFGRVH